MSSTALKTSIAVAAAIGIVFVFFIYNPFQNVDTNSQSQGAAVPNSTGSVTLTTNDLVVGTGDVAKAGDKLTVNYTGKLENGTVFDTSVGKQPFVFTLGTGMVIPGWDQGIVGMKVGGKRTLIIPPAMAYGAQGVGPIPPNATLTFDVELLKVTPAPAK
jgi:FKBP-type peptidyl-prolyl cis-trans isomerase FkpA